MMKKKTITCIILFALMLSAVTAELTGCSLNNNADTAVQVLEEKETTEKVSADIAIEKQKLYSGNGVTMTATGIEKTFSGYEIKIAISNKSNLNLGFNAHSYAVNGIMTQESIYAMDYDVAAGKKVNAVLKIDNSFLNNYGITDIRCVDVNFWAYDNDKYFKEFETGQIEIKTNLYNKKHDTIKKEKIYDDAGIRVDYIESDRDNYTFAIRNTTGEYFDLTVSDLSVNDYTVSDIDYDLYDEQLLDKSTIVSTIKIKNKFKNENDIDTVKKIEFNLDIKPGGDPFNSIKVGPIIFTVK